MNNLLVTVFSDASVSDGRAGCGFWFKSSEAKGKGSSSIDHESISVGEAELWGIFIAITAAAKSHDVTIDVVIQCDSMMALQALHTKGHPWAKTSSLKWGTRRKISAFEQSHADRISNIANVGKIYLKHVKGHTKRADARSYVNDLTDKLASNARKARTEVA